MMRIILHFFTYGQRLSTKTYWAFFAFILAIYLGLITFQVAILTLTIPQEFTLQYIYLNVNSPNLSSMFFNHFMHNPLSISHMTDNIQVFILLIVLTFIAWFIILPASGCSLPKHFFPAIFLVYLIGLPFAISGISIWTGRIFQKTYVSGFSGINFALLGLFFFILFFWLYCGILRTRSTHPLSPYFLLFSVFFVISVAIGAIMMDLKNPQVGVFAHLGRFLLGLIIPVMVGIILLSKRVNQKVLFSFLLVSLLAGCAGFWIVF